MNAAPSLPVVDIAFAVQQADAALGEVEARDDLHLNPLIITRAARSRVLRAVRALEAFVRRLLILIALQFEHEIEVDVSHRPYPKKRPDRSKRAPKTGPGALPIFLSDLARPEHLNCAADPFAPAPDPFDPPPLFAAPILRRLQRLRETLNAAEARGHRLAYVLARRRHGLLLPPLPVQLSSRIGTEVSSLYRGFGSAILQCSRHRPPPQKPRPPPPPRARFI